MWRWCSSSCAMVLLGFWQLRRLDEKRDLKATVEARQEEPAADVQACCRPAPRWETPPSRRWSTAR